MLNEYQKRFIVLTIRFQIHNEEMMITAFEQGMAAGPFNDSLIRNLAKTFSEVRERVVTHIEVEEAMLQKNGTSCSR